MPAIVYIYVLLLVWNYLIHNLKRTHTETKTENGNEARRDDINELYKASLSGSTTTLDDLMRKDSVLLYRIALSSWRETPLHISTSNGHLEFSKTLLDRNPRLAVEVDNHKRCPLHLACAEGHIEIGKALLRANKNACLIPDEDGRLPLHYAVKSGLVELVRELIGCTGTPFWLTYPYPYRTRYPYPYRT